MDLFQTAGTIFWLTSPIPGTRKIIDRHDCPQTNRGADAKPTSLGQRLNLGVGPAQEFHLF